MVNITSAHLTLTCFLLMLVTPERLSIPIIKMTKNSLKSGPVTSGDKDNIKGKYLFTLLVLNEN